MYYMNSYLTHFRVVYKRHTNFMCDDMYYFEKYKNRFNVIDKNYYVFVL